jgi:hypothetical protein
MVDMDETPETEHVEDEMPQPEAPVPDPHVEAAYSEEQSLLNSAIERAVNQAAQQHLLMRAVNLNADLRRLKDSTETDK